MFSFIYIFISFPDFNIYHIQTTVIEAIPSRIEGAEDLIGILYILIFIFYVKIYLYSAPDEAITMPPIERRVGLDRRGLDLGFADLTEMGIDLELDLDIDQQLEEQERSELQISVEPDLPEPRGIISQAVDLQDLSASAEPIIPTIPSPPSLIQPDIEPIRIDQIPPPPPSVISEATPTIQEIPELQPIPSREEKEREEATQRVTKPRKKRKKRKFERDIQIELTDDELKIDLNDIQEMKEFQVDRPQIVKCSI